MLTREHVACVEISTGAGLQIVPDFADVTRIRIVTGTHDSIDFLVRHRPGPERERCRCAVKREVK